MPQSWKDHKNKAYGLTHGLRPPFICPWRTPPDNCAKISMDQKEHQDHIHDVHESRSKVKETK